MNDQEIVALYWDRDERALTATAERYGDYCYAVSYRILSDRADAEECVNDTWLRAWDSIPPRRPAVLAAYLGKLARNLAFDRYRRRHAAKRGGGETALVLEELAECVSGREDVEGALEQKELGAAIRAFLKTLPEEKRELFLLRYWHSFSMREIAERQGSTEGNAAVQLSGLRKQLKQYLLERGYEI